MSLISDGGMGARRAAEDAARRAREEAARRAQETARQAALEASSEAAAGSQAQAAHLAATRQRYMPVEDRLERPVDTRLFAAPRPLVALPDPASPTIPLVRLTSGGLDDTPAPPAPPPPDPLTDEQAQELVQVFDAAAEAWASLPPDLQTVTVRPGDPPAALVEAWVEAARAGIGPGDPGAFAAYVSREEDALRQLALVLTPPDVAPQELVLEGDRSTFVNSLAAPALAALQREHPDAELRLLAVESGALPVRDLGAFWGENTSQLVIEMSEDGVVQHLALNPYFLLQPTPGASDVVAALRSDPALLEGWYAATRDVVPPHVDQGSAEATLDTLDAMHVPEAILYGVLEMPLEAQADFVQAFGAAAGGSAERPFALLNRVDGITPDEVLVSVDARVPFGSGVETVANVGAVDGLGKIEAFVAQNYETVVAPGFAQYLALRGDAARALGGPDLVNEIGAAMHLPPDHVPRTAEELELLRQGQWEFYDGDSRALIAPIAERIDAVAGVCPAQVAVLPVTYYSEQTGIVELPLFRVDVPGGEAVFVDNEGRDYESFDAWRQENRLPPGQFTYAAGGHLQPGEGGRALTVTETTPRTVDTVREWALQAGDVVALVGGFVVAAAAVVGSGGALLPVTAAALATWGGARSAGNLIDRARHGQTLGLGNPEARAEWLNLGASTLGVAALGSSSLARALAGAGSRWAPLATAVARGTYVGAEVADGATMLDLGHRLVTDPSLRFEDRLAIVSQLAFWGGMGAIEHRAQRGLYSLESAEWHLASQASLREGRPVLPSESGLTPRFESAVATALSELGVDWIGFRGSSPGGSFWHDVGGPTQRDSWKVVSNFMAGGTVEAGAYVPTKPEGAFTLARINPDGTADLTVARALDQYLRGETGVGLLDSFPALEHVILTDSSGNIVGLQPMLGGAVPVVMNPQMHTVTVDGREVQVPVGPVAITVSDFDIAYAVRDGQPLTEQEIREQLIPAINRAYGEMSYGIPTYDVVNHPDHASGMLDAYLNERYGLSGERYWDAPVYNFDPRGYTGESPLGPTVRQVMDLPEDWHGGPRPE